MACFKTSVCCESGVQGDQECQSQCIRKWLINDGYKDCPNGSDEGITGTIHNNVCKIFFRLENIVFCTQNTVFFGKMHYVRKNIWFL